jgi:cytochrome c oxidase subunit 4
MTSQTLIRIWAALVALTALEAALAFQKLAAVLFLIVLLGLSIAKAGMIIAWFMHLKYEKRSLAIALFVPLITFILTLFGLLPDSWRMDELRTH